MSQHRPVELKKLSTGVPGLDEVLGGGLPEFSFNLIAGEPGAGKTSLVHQLIFANATVERPALYFTALGEPSLKMLRYQQQLSFFDAAKVGTALRYVDLSETILNEGLAGILQRMTREVDAAAPSIVAVDSFRTVLNVSSFSGPRMDVPEFLQRLALHLASWQATTFLLGEYASPEAAGDPVFTIADGIIWLVQHIESASMVRKLHVKKVRGQAPIPGHHTFTISKDGLEVFPRVAGSLGAQRLQAADESRVLLGVPGIDEMMQNGMRADETLLVAGPTGTGKSVLCSHYLAEGIRQQEAVLLVSFEEEPADFIARADDLGFGLAGAQATGKLNVLYLRPLDLSVDEVVRKITRAVQETGAKRLVIDSLTGFELAIAPSFRDDFRESLYRMVNALKSARVSILMTVEVSDSYQELRFSPHAISFLSENVLFLRYVELNGRLERILGIIKMRRSEHSRELRAYDIQPRQGIVVRGPLKDYSGLLTGAPSKNRAVGRSAFPGLTEDESTVFELLVELGESTSAAIVARTHIAVEAVERALARLVALAYVIAAPKESTMSYRAVARQL
jgi:circadian clock protein KaiC